jgi:maleylpyruvate isomerase
MTTDQTQDSIHDPSRALDDQVAGCAAAHQRLLKNLDSLVESSSLDPSAPSLLPDWTVGHVLTHLARNAEAIANMMNGAAAGEERLMYPSAEARDNDINDGATRSAQELIDDLRKSVWAVESSWARLSGDAWNGFGLARGGRVPVAELPFRRWREVEIHHADLGLNFAAKDWSPSFIATDLPGRLADWASEGNVLPEEVAKAASWQQLAWLSGRPSGLTTPAPKWL